MTTPQLLCWLMCDGVHIDPGSGKHYILGTFSNIRVRQFPATHPRMIWFLTIADVPVGLHRLQIYFGPTMEPPNEIVNREFQSKSPLHRINLINEIQNLQFDQSGTYSIMIEVNDETILVTSLTVTN